MAATHGRYREAEAAARIAALIQRVNTSADLAEGKRAFFEKRRPAFRGE